MKLLLSGTTDTQADLSDWYRIKLNGSHTYLDAAADFGLSAGQARRVTIVIYLSNITIGSDHTMTIKQCLTDASGYGDHQHYFPPVIQTTKQGQSACVISFDTFVHHIGELNYLIVEIFDDYASLDPATVSAFVFSDGFGENGQMDDPALQKAIKMLINKAAQDKLTGAIQYYDDDGETVILTHTPSENESSLTRVPS